MKTDNEIKTELGQYSMDRSGLWHYNYKEFGDVLEAVGDALKHRDARVAWFWFNGTPCPIYVNDSVTSLLDRWDRWRNIYIRNPSDLLVILSELTK